jgi:predicted outer membrane protein
LPNTNPAPAVAPASSPPQNVTANKLVFPGPRIGRGADQEIATLLAIGNQEEVSMANIAVAKIQNADVRSFAESMIHDHTEFLQKLAQFGGFAGFGIQDAGNRGVTTPIDQRSLDTPNSAQGGTAAPGRPELPAGQAQFIQGQAPIAQSTQPGLQQAQANPAQLPNQLNFVTVKRQIVEACIASAQRDLQAKKPYEAEMDYAGTQIVAHKQMLDTMKVLRQYASGELQPVLDQGIQTTQMHLQKAEKLVKDLADSRSSESSRNR